MKKILKPQEPEESVYYSDFSGECFGMYEPPVIVTFKFNYGSSQDGEIITYHLNDNEAQKALDFFKSRAIANKNVKD